MGQETSSRSEIPTPGSWLLAPLSLLCLRQNNLLEINQQNKIVGRNAHRNTGSSTESAPPAAQHVGSL